MQVADRFVQMNLNLFLRKGVCKVKFKGSTFNKLQFYTKLWLWPSEKFACQSRGQLTIGHLVSAVVPSLEQRDGEVKISYLLKISS